MNTNRLKKSNWELIDGVYYHRTHALSVRPVPAIRLYDDGELLNLGELCRDSDNVEPLDRRDDCGDEG